MKYQVLAVISIIIVLSAFSINATKGASLQSNATFALNGIIQQTSTGTYTYIVSVSGSNYQIKNGATQQIAYQSTNAAQIINTAIINLTANQKMYFTTGTYTLTTSIEIANKDNGALVFQPGAKLFVANGMGKSAIFIHDGSDNWIIDGIEIDGNAANQNIGGWSPPNGIAIYNDCSNITTINANIHDCWMYGWVAWENVRACGIRDSVLTNCNWNCIELGASVLPTTIENGLYAINNTCTNSGDVGITTYGIGNTIQGNRIYNMTGIHGSCNSQWAIGVEGGHGHLISDNIIVTATRGMSIEQTDGLGSNMITGNTITTCGFGIVVVSPNNTIINNTISNFDMYGWSQQAIAIEGSYGGANNNKVLNNSISSTNGVAHAILIDSANDTQFNDNKINVPRAGTSWFAIQISASSRTTISRNTLIGFMSIIIGDAACQSTTITNNDFTKCNSETGAITDYGTGTIINGNLT